MAKISNPPVVRAVLNECCAVAVRLEDGKKAADDEDKWSAEQCALWQKITEPYAGNLLFVDFCGNTRTYQPTDTLPFDRIIWSRSQGLVQYIIEGRKYDFLKKL